MLGVGSVQRSLEFYRDKVSFAVQRSFPGFAFLDGGGVSLVLSEPLARAGNPVAGAVEIVLSVDGVRESFEQLRSRGVEFIQEPRAVAAEQWAANFRDPDGHVLSLYGPETKTQTQAVAQGS